MIRSILRSLSRLIMAVVLFALLLCAMEVWLRWERLNQPASISDVDIMDQLVRPSTTTWLEVADLADLEMPVSLQETTQLRTTEYGTRGESVTVPKPANTFRVLCLGGARLFGWGQREEATITKQLESLFAEAQLSHVEFINAGCPECGVITNYLRLRRNLITLQPDLILYCISPEDIEEDEELRGGLSLDQDGKPAYAIHPASGTEDQDELNRLCEEFATVDWLTKRVGPMIGLRESKGTTATPESDQSGNFKSLVDMKELCDAYQCQIMVSIIPNMWSQSPKTGQMKSLNLEAFERDVHEYFAEHQIQSTSLVHNPNSLFQQHAQQQELFDERSGYLTPTGNVMYARTIAKSMVDYFPVVLQIPSDNHPQPLPAPSSLPTSPPTLPQETPVPLTNYPESILR